jgi:uncharacterized protein
VIDIDPDRTVYDLTEENPRLIEILAGLGFATIRNPAARTTMGRVVTLRKGCRVQGKDLAEVGRALEAAGFRLVQK